MGAGNGDCLYPNIQVESLNWQLCEVRAPRRDLIWELIVDLQIIFKPWNYKRIQKEIGQKLSRNIVSDSAFTKTEGSRENEDSEDLKITKEAKCIVRGKEGVTRAGRVQGEGLTVRKMRNMSFVEADGGEKEMNIDVVSFVASIKRRLRWSYVIEPKKNQNYLT